MRPATTTRARTTAALPPKGVSTTGATRRARGSGKAAPAPAVADDKLMARARELANAILEEQGAFEGVSEDAALDVVDEYILQEAEFTVSGTAFSGTCVSIGEHELVLTQDLQGPSFHLEADGVSCH